MELREFEKTWDEMNKKERDKLFDYIAKVLSQPSWSQPKKVDIYEKYGIPENTFYWRISKNDFKQKIVDNSLNEAKDWVPDLMAVLKEKAVEDKSERSIKMALKYITEIRDKMDVTSKGEKVGFSLSELYEKAKEEERI